MAPSEHEAIRQIGEGVTATRELMASHVADFRVFKTKLLGDDEAELPSGRIPLIEAEIKRLKHRQDRQARIIWTATGFVLCLNVIGWALNLASQIHGVFKR
jgi:hypothetical protein